MAAYNKDIDIKLARYGENMNAKKELSEEDKDMIDTEEGVSSSVPIQVEQDSDHIIDEEEMEDCNGNRVILRERRKRRVKDDEEEKARTMKYQVHEMEVVNEDDSDMIVWNIKEVWLCG